MTQKSINLKTQIYPNPIKKDENQTNDEIVCEYCERSFSSLSHLSRHKKKSCKIKVEQEKQKKNLLN